MARLTIPRRRILVPTILLVMSVSFQLQLLVIVVTTIVPPTLALGGSNIFGFFRKRRHKFSEQHQLRATAETKTVVVTTTATETTTNHDDAVHRSVDSLTFKKSVESASFIGAKGTVVSPEVILIVSSNSKSNLQKTIGWTTSAWNK